MANLRNWLKCVFYGVKTGHVLFVITISLLTATEGQSARILVKEEFASRMDLKEAEKKMLESLIRYMGPELLKNNEDEDDVVEQKTDAKTDLNEIEVSEKKLNDEISDEQNERLDDSLLSPAYSCDTFESESRTCIYVRQLGITLTLALNFKGDILKSRIRWYRHFKKRDSDKEIVEEFTRGFSPWNVVIGAGNTELRLSPVTETDFSYNYFVAKVDTARGSLKKNIPTTDDHLNFKIVSIPVELGFVYNGEELIINIRRYIEIPVEGVAFDWHLKEENRGLLWDMPSNAKISDDGSSVTIKELRRMQNVQIICSMYSNKKVFIAQRIFRIGKIAYLDNDRASPRQPTKYLQQREVKRRRRKRRFVQARDKTHGHRTENNRSFRSFVEDQEIGKWPGYQNQKDIDTEEYHLSQESKMNLDNDQNGGPIQKNLFYGFAETPIPIYLIKGPVNNNFLDTPANTEGLTLPQLNQETVEEANDIFAKPVVDNALHDPQLVMGNALHDPEQVVHNALHDSQQVVDNALHDPQQVVNNALHDPIFHEIPGMPSDNDEGHPLSTHNEGVQESPKTHPEIINDQMESHNGRLLPQFSIHQGVHGNGISFENANSHGYVELKEKQGLNIYHNTPIHNTKKNAKYFFEDREAKILSQCHRNTECSSHGYCYVNEDPGFCRCLEGYVGNGIFCEIVQ